MIIVVSAALEKLCGIESDLYKASLDSPP